MPFLLIDKPEGMTSHDVVDRVRAITGERRVGHGGTLDPMASGLLIVGVGREATRKLGTVTKGMDKKYNAEIVLGEERDTDDREGMVITKAVGVLPPPRKEIEATLGKFIGRVSQVPPQFSAVKTGGKKAYQQARMGERVHLEPRKVTIYSIKLIDYRYPIIEIESKVSSGTYIRALARDIGRMLGTGAYLGRLRRLRIGTYAVEQAVELDRLGRENWKTHAIEF
ncbi:MAG: tRNA pseudouridine(55) synthase TruB [Candidatus Chisholmbacteria bacterium RIFCSPLOWO2_01_FULL_50_28]|uniref:tRNA pseudouridine synthase B n=1 Tax=Candidatus Chisholmbacteria bacterium RIFCSPHIGHO2_01_FULL_52_32 TaxID=1797591 RepID=A0A1G1VSJ3_9BACT|nr:MAG: tRNA pseudouridine(55) synthase TruB [Candidatus Chisholmbacteria bacterium RIFCSPHIGHO2_01_FULL_52_32]OGY20450.1 MAG: tRNA pseudouridine(55) synthase TruB [Candidatus Chisholmbacteria bacterium RIFCSPLOWO2_01_FULL_50_28]